MVEITLIVLAGIPILKYADNLSGEEICIRWMENRIINSSVMKNFFLLNKKLNVLLQKSLAVAVKPGDRDPGL